MAPIDIEQAKHEARRIIERLPHFHLCLPDKIERWIDVMAEREPERLTWHALRQSGFSGSEVGTLVQNRRGDKAQFGSARKLVMQKLFLLTPDRPNEHMLRGIETEDLHRVKFMRLWNAQRDQAAYDGLTNARGRYNFLRYSPDDVVTIEGRRILVDYKSPSDVEDDGAFDIDYMCQINLGADILQKIGMPADNGLLSRLSWKDWKCVGNWVELDRDLQNEIVDAAHYYWTNFVLRADVPTAVFNSAVVELDPQIKQTLVALSASVVALDEVSAKIVDERELLLKEMKKQVELSTQGGPVGKAIVFCHDVKPVECVNVPNLTALLEMNDLDAESEIAALSDIVKIDNAKLVGDMKNDGVNLDKLIPATAFEAPVVVARLDELNIAASDVVELVTMMTSGGVTLEHYAKEREVSVPRTKERLEQLQLCAGDTIEHHFTVKKSIAKRQEVIAFKPHFADIGGAVVKRLVEVARERNGCEAQQVSVEAPVISTVALPGAALPSQEFLAEYAMPALKKEVNVEVGAEEDVADEEEEVQHMVM